MSSSFSVTFPLLTALLTLAPARAQIATGQPPTPARPPEHVEHLDQFVVSAGHDPRTSFDVAQGTLVLAGEELHRLSQATLGETLAGTPGVSSTYHGPGASRPVIRGLGGDRVRVLSNGIGTLDASNVSPDHATALEPLFASRIEVLRGPSTLLYGSSAIGGAVNVIDNAIPDTAPSGPLRGALELRAGGANRETTGVLTASGGNRALATQLNLLHLRTRDLRIPGVARHDDEAPGDQRRGILPGSASRTTSGSLGGATFWSGGRAGAALSHFETAYGVPTGEDEPTTIRLRRNRLEAEGELKRDLGPLRGATARLAVGDYRHDEAGRDEIHATFTNRAWEGRLELPHAPVGPLKGMLGVQLAQSDFGASGEEVSTPSSLTTSGALFALEDLPLGPRISLQLGGRLEGQSISLGDVPAGLPRVPGYSARSGQRRQAAGASASLGLVFRPAPNWALAASLARSERLPTVQELFSHGPHGGTRAYEVGTSSLGRERSLGLDVSLRRRAGFITGSIGAFTNRFDDYIHQRKLPEGTVPASAHGEELTPYQFVATDARFTGGEADLLLHLIEDQHTRLHLAFTSDLVRATATRTGEPLPRITPRHHAVRLGYEDGRWHALAEVRRVDAQRRVAPDESPTAAYTLLNASVSVLIPGQHAGWEVFLRGRNLANVAAREHGSFLKDRAPLPGRGLLAGLRLTF